MKALSICAAVLLFASCAPTTPGAKAGGEAGHGAEWLTDFDAARALAARKNVPILANFAGSDWCGWCIRLDEEVLSREEFSAYADGNLVLLLVDFPSRKKQAPEVKARNESLAKKYGVQGFPTVVLMDSEGRPIARTGYRKGGPEEYIEHLKALLKK